MSKRWYVVHVYSGMEKACTKALIERIDRAALQTSFGRILVPSEEVVEMKGGQKSITERRIFPGYVLVEMDLTDETWHPGQEHQPRHRLPGWLGQPSLADFRERSREDPQPDGRGRRKAAPQGPRSRWARWFA